MKDPALAFLGARILLPLATILAAASLANGQGVRRAPSGQTPLVSGPMGGARDTFPDRRAPFSIRQFPATSGLAYYLDTGDFDGDGILDLVSAYWAPVVYRGRRDGTFAPSRYVHTDEFAASAKLGDLDGDGKDDLVVLHTETGYLPLLGVFLADGAGGFGSPTSYSAGTGEFTWYLGLGDVNGDGDLDVVAGQSDDGSIWVWLGVGDGTLAAPLVQVSGGSFVWRTLLGDLNGDDDLDITTVISDGSGTSEIVTLLGNGDGTFASAASQGLMTGATLALADLDGDDDLDLVTSDHYLNQTAFVRLGNGDGSFGTPATFPTGVDTMHLAIGDIDEDGNLDLCFSARGLKNYGQPVARASVLLGDGAGSFGAPPAADPIGFYVKDLILRDLDGDGHLDLVVVNSTGTYAAVTVFPGTGNGSFEQPSLHMAAQENWPGDLTALADLDGDGDLDLAVDSSTSAEIRSYLNNGDGTFQPAVSTTNTAGAWDWDAGDLDEDGNADLVLCEPSSAQAWILLGAGDGSFAAPTTHSSGLNDFTCLRLVDLDDDGFLDMVCAGDTYANEDVSRVMGKGDGTFGSLARYATGFEGVLAMTLADFDGDDDLDLAATGFDWPDDVAVLPGNWIGGFGQPAYFAAGGEMYGGGSIEAADLDGDGNLDLVVGGGKNTFGPHYGGVDRASVLLGNGDCTFTTVGRVWKTTEYIHDMTLADLDADGWTDVVFHNPLGYHVLPGRADGIFSQLVSYATGYATDSMAAGDVDGDGDCDLASGTAILRNQMID